MKATGLVAFMLTVTVAVVAQQRDTTNAPSPAVAGAGEVAGAVLSSDGEPIRRAVVTLTGDVPVPRSTLSDDAGKFTFASLPAGTFQVSARKASYLAAPYGAMRPGRAGTSIALIAGQKAAIRITMFKGAAITGVLRDSAGLPLAGVDVRAVDVRTLTALDSSPIEMATTDDRGVFRIYNLLPGDYVVVALPGAMGTEIGAPSSMDLDATLAALATRDRTTGAVTPTSQPVPPPRARPIGFAPVFFPGTPQYLDATRVRVGPGEERAGIDFELKPVPVAAIDAIVTPPLLGAQVTLIPTGPRFSTSFSSASLAGRPMDSEGKFRYSNLPPGRYRLVARVRSGGADPPGPVNVTSTGAGGGGGGRGGSTLVAGTGQPEGGDYLYGYADVELRGEDIAGINLVLQSGAVMTGRIVLNGTAAGVKPVDITKTRITLSPEGGGWNVSSNGLAMGPSLSSQAISTIKPDGTFELRGIGPGQFTLSVALPSDAKGWSLQSATIVDRDLLDDAIDMVPGREIRDVTVTFSDAPAELSGTLQSASGQPTTDYYILLLPSDRALWRQKSRRILSARPSTAGRFGFTNVPAGSYVLAALSDLDALDLLDMSFLEQIAPAGVRVTMGEAEKKVQDLRIK
jgi:hypothetical protein